MARKEHIFKVVYILLHLIFSLSVCVYASISRSIFILVINVKEAVGRKCIVVLSLIKGQYMTTYGEV
jgi:hypothetical protein